MNGSGNLVVACVGDGSLHPGWLAPVQARAEFDLLLVYYGNEPDRYAGDGDVYVRDKGSKSELVSRLLATHGEVLARYERVWMPDDDLATDAGTIARMFRLFEREGLALAQPALAAGSHWSHGITRRRRWATLRYTDFVEVMAPLLRRDALALVAPTFEESRSGWGLDYLWAHLVRRAGLGPVAILDATPVTHTRPIDPKSGSYRALGLDGAADRDGVVERHGIRRRERTLGAVVEIAGRTFRPRWRA